MIDQPPAEQQRLSAAPRFDFKKSLKETDLLPWLRLFRVERYFTRPLASVIARLAYSTAITPNHLTYVSLLLGIAAAAAFLGGRPEFFALGGILTLLSSVFDCTDGMLARSRNACTRYGAFLDLYCDRVVDLLILNGIALGWFFHTGDRLLLIIGLLNTGLYFLQVILFYLMREYQRINTTGQTAEARGLILFAILAGSLLGRLDILILGITAIILTSIIVKFLRFARMGGSGDQA